MKKANRRCFPRVVLPEYDFSTGVRGKYTARFRRGTNLVRLDPDVSETFPTTRSVNAALRALAGALRATRRSRTT